MSAPSGPPAYRGEPLDAARGPGLGCFWLQVIVLAVLLVLTPLTVMWAWDPAVSAILLFLTLGVLFFAGQTVIFLLRLVSADRRSRRRPLDPRAGRTVGQLEDEATPASPAPDEGGVSVAGVARRATMTDAPTRTPDDPQVPHRR